MWKWDGALKIGKKEPPSIDIDFNGGKLPINCNQLGIVRKATLLENVTVY